MTAAALPMGVEEEFLLVDPSTGVPVPCVGALLGDTRTRPETPPGAVLQRELRETQIEATTGVCRSAAELRAHVSAGRQAVEFLATMHGVRAIATGLPFRASEDAPAAVGRYADIDDIFGPLTTGYEACGTHVHVEVPDRDTAVAVVNHLRPWLPTLLALSVNSPFERGRDTGYGSWRAVLQSRFPGSGVTPWFAGHADYRKTVEMLVDWGSLVDPTMTFWLARPSPHLPTVEFRVADSATTADEAVLYALLGRALVRTALDELARGREAPALPQQLCASALWSASRNGLDGDGVDVRDRTRVTAWDLLGRLLRHVHGALCAADDDVEVAGLVDAMRARGTGAQRQRQRRGPGGSLTASLISSAPAPIRSADRQEAL
ncbi:carboxylate-amine ligase [Amycolatopsis antarctica]|uniref:carboxylate-amine ligase n=1 Tax=Amycolatopsis antarctica TaxID=1854586 RepID=UPI00105583B9|nr:glutamate--cysteine ligase [Amycolatopsis antarctica]